MNSKSLKIKIIFSIFFSLFLFLFVSVVQSLPFVEGQIGKFAVFNGTSFKDVRDSGNIHLTKFTVIAWFKTSHDFSSPGFILNKGGFGSEKSGENMNYGMWISNTEQVMGGFESKNGENYFINSPEKYNDDKWHHSAITYDGKSLTLYIDGDLITTKDTDDAIPDIEGNQLFRIGANSLLGERPFIGSIDELRVWNRTLDAVEIQNGFKNNLYNNFGQVIYVSMGDISIPPNPPTENPPPSNVQCKPLLVEGLESSGHQSDLPPENALDGDPSTRWSALGLGSWIDFDFGEEKKVCDIDITWHRGNERIMDFIISTSLDGINYRDVFSGKSNGISTSPEKYNLNSSLAKHLRITVVGNTMNNWVSISDVQLNGVDKFSNSTLPNQNYSKINVITNVINDNGGTKQPSDFNIKVIGNNPNPNQFSGVSNQAGISVTILSGQYNIVEDNIAGYTTTYSPECSGTIGTNAIKVCTITNNDNPSPPTTEPGKDIFGIPEVYPTKQGGQTWFMNMQDMKADPRFEMRGDVDDVIKNPDGSWTPIPGTKVRLAGYTEFSVGNFDGDNMPNYNYKFLENQGYWYAPSDFKNVEMTGYVKLKDADDMSNGFSWFARSISHTSGEDTRCGGGAYKFNLGFDGEVKAKKEMWHVSYFNSPAVHPEELGNSLKGKWIGYKGIVYNLADGSGVKQEIWLDMKNNNVWKKVFEHYDKGGWGAKGTAGGETCGGDWDQKITWGSPKVVFRWDNAQVDFKYLSVREIQVPPN